MSIETNDTIDTLEIVQRPDGKWMVEDVSYRFSFGPYESRDAAQAKKGRIVAQRISEAERYA